MGWRRVGNHGQGLDLPLTRSHRGKYRHPLGAHGGPEGGVFDVAAREDLPSAVSTAAPTLKSPE